LHARVPAVARRCNACMAVFLPEQSRARLAKVCSGRNKARKGLHGSVPPVTRACKAYTPVFRPEQTSASLARRPNGRKSSSNACVGMQVEVNEQPFDPEPLHAGGAVRFVEQHPGDVPVVVATPVGANLDSLPADLRASSVEMTFLVAAMSRYVFRGCFYAISAIFCGLVRKPCSSFVHPSFPFFSVFARFCGHEFLQKTKILRVPRCFQWNRIRSLGIRGG
jgi:hypothetical protein